MSRAIGFIGLGIMGKPMARNLMKAGYPLVVYNRTASKAQELVSGGARQVGSSREVAGQAEVIITMVADSPEVEQVILGPQGVLETVKAGSVVIDMSSISPVVTKKIAAELARRSEWLCWTRRSAVERLEPFRGRSPSWSEGDEAVFEEVRPVLEKMGKSVVRVGEIGAGGFTKLSNQIIVAAALQAIAEAMVLAQKAGVDIQRVYEAIKGGHGGWTNLRHENSIAGPTPV